MVQVIVGIAGLLLSDLLMY